MGRIRMGRIIDAWLGICAGFQSFGANSDRLGPVLAPSPHGGGGSQMLNGSEVWSVLEAALPRSVFVHTLSAKACADVDNCVGTVAATGDCVCDQLDG